jgi:hypothetical protein
MGHYGGYKLISTGLIDGTLDVAFDGGTNADGGDFGSAVIGGQVGTHGRLFLKVNLNNGNDTFLGTLSSLAIAAAGEVHVDARGGNGNDGISLAQGSIKNSGLLAIELEGNDGDDILYFNPGPITNAGVLRMRVDGGLGNDNINANVPISAYSTSASRLDLYVLAGAGDDKVTFALNNNGPNQTTNYVSGLAVVDGGLGSDTCALSGNGRTHKRNCKH